jgi:hypothetical protein
VGQIKGLFSQNNYSRGDLWWKIALSITEQGQKAARQRKILLVRKSYSLYFRVMVQKGVDDVSEDDDE